MLDRYENAIKVEGHGYIEMHECDEGWDWTAYRPDLTEVDGGVIDEHMDADEAFSNILSMLGIEKDVRWEAVDIDVFDELLRLIS